MPATARHHRATAAAILIEMSHELEALGAGLCADPALAAGHFEHLQRIDLIAQQQLELARLIEGAFHSRALDRLRLEHMRHRFHHAAAG